MNTYTSNIKSILLEEIHKAEKDIKIAVCWFNDLDIYKLLVQKAKNGVKIEIIITNDHINIEKNKINWFEIVDLCGRVYLYKKGHIMHLKECLIDNKTFIQGTYNWTNKASKNIERVSIYYNNEFDINSTIIKYNEIKLQCSILTRNENKKFINSEVKLINGKYGIFEKGTNEPWIPAIYDEIGQFTWGTMFLRKNNEGGFINDRLEWIIPLNSQYKYASSFINGLSIIKTIGSNYVNKKKISDNKYYLIDKNGSVVINKDENLNYYENDYHFLFNSNVIYCLKSDYLNGEKTGQYTSYKIIFNNSNVTIGYSNIEVILFENNENNSNEYGIYNNIKGSVFNYFIKKDNEKIENIYIKSFGDKNDHIFIFVMTNIDLYHVRYSRSIKKIINYGSCQSFLINYNSVFLDHTTVLVFIEDYLLRFTYDKINENNYFIYETKLFVCNPYTISSFDLKKDKIESQKTYKVESPLLLKELETIINNILKLNNGIRIEKYNYYESDFNYLYRRISEFIKKCENEKEVLKKKIIENRLAKYNEQKHLSYIENERKIDLIENEYKSLLEYKKNKEQEILGKKILAIFGFGIGIGICYMSFNTTNYQSELLLGGVIFMLISLSVFKSVRIDKDIDIKIRRLENNKEFEKRLNQRKNKLKRVDKTKLFLDLIVFGLPIFYKLFVFIMIIYFIIFVIFK